MFRLGYNTNGLAHHHLDAALDLLAAEGYAGVGITLDVHHLDPFRATANQVRSVRRHLGTLGLSCVVETGARFLLDPARKHQPTLISRDGAAVRHHFLVRAIEMAADLGAPVVSTWAAGVEPQNRRARRQEQAGRHPGEGILSENATHPY